MKFADIAQKFLRSIHIPALLMMGLLFALSSLPGGSGGIIRPPMDKVIHGAAYLVLGLLFCAWIRERRWRGQPLRHALIVLLIVGIFGLSDEFHQSFVPGRDVSLGDWAADLTGGILSLIVYLRIRAYRWVDRWRTKAQN
ncbi:MAG TPA: VanZ family protein [Fibrobacteraceae bacterium]|nr:VanZ family protein [Fibrobacteraceae bacterium]